MKKVRCSKRKTIQRGSFFCLADFGENGHLLQEVTIPPLTKQRLHRHFKQTEVWYVLSGNASIFVNDTEYISTTGDAFIASPGDTHQLWNKTNEPFRVGVFKINMPPDSDDTEWLED